MSAGQRVLFAILLAIPATIGTRIYSSVQTFSHFQTFKGAAIHAFDKPTEGLQNRIDDVTAVPGKGTICIALQHTNHRHHAHVHWASVPPAVYASSIAQRFAEKALSRTKRVPLSD
jgi:hypothetical protein